ncbi:unnamed protein product [Peronospora destructor]|uniref:Uncharacterized protein n=1 Tax=Peronospora destructor TaxID=86335 RepID=A0AAV0V243_9STRA|nr:unnamed protein product [Peronospora destructor]
MYMLSQFPMIVQVDLPEFVQSVERAAAYTVLPRLYGHEVEETQEFLAQTQLDVNTTALEAVGFTRERVEENVTSEWLTLRVQYNVTEHLRIDPRDGTSCDDRRAINTRFVWTFEADVTNADDLEWAIVAAKMAHSKSSAFVT